MLNKILFVIIKNKIIRLTLIFNKMKLKNKTQNQLMNS